MVRLRVSLMMRETSLFLPFLAGEGGVESAAKIVFMEKERRGVFN